MRVPTASRRRTYRHQVVQTWMTAGEISERFEMSKPALSKHLKILENAGLVCWEKTGQFVHYRLADRNLINTVHDFMTTFCPLGGSLKNASAAVARKRAQVPIKLKVGS